MFPVGLDLKTASLNSRFAGVSVEPRGMPGRQRKASQSWLKQPYHEILPCQTDRLDGALEVDGGFLLWVAGVRKVDLRPCSLHDMFDVAPVPAHHEEVMLGRDVQLCAHGDGRCQASRKVFQ